MARAEAPQPTASFRTVSDSTNDFGFRLLRTIVRSRSGDNVIVSPLSVSLALSIAYNGAAGETKSAIAKTLGISALSDDELNRGNRDLVNTIELADPSVKMDIANALWAQSGFAINPDFLKLARDWYDAPVESLDFVRNPEHAADVINAWVDKNTHGKIAKIIERAKKTDRLIITDAVYFKGEWALQFHKEETKPRDFHLQKGRSIKAPMMSQRGEYPYFENDDFQAIRLPYGNKRFSVYVFLPRKNDGLSNFLTSLDEKHWKEWTDRLSNREGTIVLPKLESSWGMSLNEALKSMGMTIAFDKSKADFSGIHPPDPWRLYVGDVEQKTYVKVDEEGTEAAAVTSVEMAVAAIVIAKPPPFEMIVDHPFFCAITERDSGTLLFAGVVMNPTRRD